MREIWARVPELPCTGACHEACGIIPVLPAEIEVIRARYGQVDISPGINGVCRALTPGGRCSVYEARPLICRLFGVSEGLECHAGCKPSGRYLTKDEAHDLIQEMDEIL